MNKIKNISKAEVLTLKEQVSLQFKEQFKMLLVVVF